MTAATVARERRGLGLDTAAARLRISPRYLRTVELHGGANYALACRASALYECPVDIFLYATTNSGGETPKTPRLRRSPTTRQKIKRDHM